MLVRGVMTARTRLLGGLPAEGGGDILTSVRETTDSMVFGSAQILNLVAGGFPNVICDRRSDLVGGE